MVVGLSRKTDIGVVVATSPISVNDTAAARMPLASGTSAARQDQHHQRDGKQTSLEAAGILGAHGADVEVESRTARGA
jgi:hypothetical protein